MKARSVLLWLSRETRGSKGRLGFFVACLGIGVAAIVSVAGLSTSLQEGIRSEGRKLIAADLVIRGGQVLPVEVRRNLEERGGLHLTHIKEMVTMVAAPPSPAGPGTSRLVELKVVDGEFPFYGDLDLEIRSSPTEPSSAQTSLVGPTLTELLDVTSAVVAPELALRLHLALGDDLLIGGEPFRVAGFVRAEPDKITDAFTLGPRVFLSEDGFSRTELEQTGSTITYHTLVKLSEGADPEVLASEVRELLGKRDRFEVRTFSEALPELRRGIRRVEKFLSLVALLSLLLGGVGVAQTTRVWIATKTESIAILRALGVRPREVLGLYFLQSALLGLSGGLVGVVAGIGLQAALPSLLGDLLLNVSSSPIQGGAVLRGLGLGLGVALLFSFGPLLATRRVSPLRVLRKDVEPLPGRRVTPFVTGSAVTLGIVAMSAIQSGSLRMGAFFAAGLVFAGLLLALSSLLLMRGTSIVARRSRKTWLRQALASLSRPGAATVGSAVALGIGVLLILGLSLVEQGLRSELEGTLPPSAPSAFLIDIQPDQWSGLEALLLSERASAIDSVPVVTARLASIDGRSTEQIAAETPEDRSRQWALTREQRLTYLEKLPADNKILKGSLWSSADLTEVSIEEDFARELGVDLGSVLEFDLQGVPLELTVTSVRSVDWGTFGVNFYLVVEPGALEEAPQYRIAVAQLPAGSDQRIQDLLASQYPNVTILNLRSLLDKIAAVVRRLASGVRFLGAFSVLAGIVILAGAVSAESVRRGREVALLKTLGMTRWGVARMIAVQYALIGGIAGFVGVGGGNILSWIVLTQGWEISWSWRPLPSALAVVAAVILAAGTGVASSWPALKKRPVEVLRGK